MPEVMQNPPWVNPNRRTISAPKNPLDQSTVVSIFPVDVVEVKPTIQPGIFKIPKGSYENPSVLVVGSSSWWREIDEHQPLLEIPNSSVQIAQSIVVDYSQGLFCYSKGNSEPGLFWVPGSFDAAGIKKNFKKELDLQNTLQRTWYTEVVKMADVLWSRSSNNPLSINQLMKIAAEQLGLKNKAWMQDFTTIHMGNCPACGSLHNPIFPICAVCKYVVNKDRAKELGIS